MPNPSQLAIDVHLGTAQVQATAPSGTSLDLQLPFGSLYTRSLEGDRRDRGVGDLELRARQSVSRFLRVPALGLGLTLGVAAPTGPYVARSGAANLAPEASYLTLGRGATWWIAEADLRYSIGTRASLFAQLGGRGPFSRTHDGFQWGAEVRATIGAQVTAVRRWLSCLLVSELLWRDGASEPDPFSSGRLESANAGGIYWSLSPALLLELPRGFSLLAGARVPVLSDGTGNQLVPQVGGFITASFSRAFEPPRRRAQRFLPRPGLITVVDYWASWCAPCVEISKALEAAARRWPDVRLIRIDATAWPAEALPRELPGATGLPVVEIFDARGNLVTTLRGSEAQEVVPSVETLRQSASSSPRPSPSPPPSPPPSPKETP